MMPHTNTQKSRFSPLSRICSVMLLLAFSASPLAAEEAKKQLSKGEPVTAGQIAMYVGIIVGLALIAWFLATREKKVEDKHHATIAKHHHGSHHHSNDPYFKRRQH